jgi:uridine kinase
MEKEKKAVKIQIIGATATGKSTLSWMILKNLIEAGIEVEYNQPANDYRNINHLQQCMEHDFNSVGERLSMLKDNIKIVVSEIQTCSEPIINKV